jgi:heterotetrameric sarcosine oxidase gamma subunit
MSAVMAPAVRRSAIEVAHVALGAAWLSDDIRWPSGYGDASVEASAVASAAGLAELGPYEELLLRGPAASEVAASLAAGTAAPERPAVVPVPLGGVTGAAWFLAPDEVLLVGALTGWSAELVAGVASRDVSAIEMTGARATLRLVGPAAPAILAELCPADTTPATLLEGALIQAPLAGPRVFLTRRDHGGWPGYTWMLARDEARFVWESALHVGTHHGLVAVGPAAVGVDR